MAKVVQHLPETGFSKSTLWAKVAQGEFPKPHKLGPRITTWRVEDLVSWIAARGTSRTGGRK